MTAPTPPQPTGSNGTAARQRRALELQNQGDLAAALTHWRVLLTLTPDDAGVQRQLAATKALIRHRVEAGLAAGSRAELDGDTAGARAAYLGALALDPRHRAALESLRRLEHADVYASQVARLEKIRGRRSRARAREEAGHEAAAVPALGEERDNGQERDYRDMGIVLFEAGDYEASVLELRKYLGSFPDDEAAQAVLRQAERRLQDERPVDAVPATPTLPAPPPPNDKTGMALPEVRPDATAEPPAAVSRADAAAAQQLYERAVRVSRRDIGEAIDLWEQSLARDPGHVQARVRLDQAYKIRERLEAIDRQ